MHTIDIKIWSASILFALTVHAMMFLRTGNESGLKLPSVNEISYSTRLSFKELIPHEATKEVPEVQKEIVKKVEKVIPDISRKKIKPIIEKKVVEEPEIKQTKSLANESAKAIKQEVDMVSSVDDKWLKQQRIDYFNLLIGHIEKHKFYPGSARRRGIVGKVEVCFTMTGDGGISNLQVMSNHRILKQAAVEAIESALPLPLPGEDILSSKQISFNMLYAMK